MLLLNAQRAQDCFASWEDYASAYVRARQKWLMIYDTPVATANRDLKEVTAWLKDPSSNWKKLPWNEFKILNLIKRISMEQDARLLSAMQKMCDQKCHLILLRENGKSQIFLICYKKNVIRN